MLTHLQIRDLAIIDLVELEVRGVRVGAVAAQDAVPVSAQVYGGLLHRCILLASSRIETRQAIGVGRLEPGRCVG